MSIHAGLQAFRDVFGEGVCRHRNNRDRGRPGVVQLPDGPGCVEPIHLRHLYIHEDQRIAALRSRAHPVHTDTSVFRSLGSDPKHREHGGDDLPVDIVILGHQDVQPLQIGIIILRFLGNGLFPGQIVDLIIERRAEQRFADEPVRTRRFRPILDVRPSGGSSQRRLLLTFSSPR